MSKLLKFKVKGGGKEKSCWKNRRGKWFNYNVCAGTLELIK